VPEFASFLVRAVNDHFGERQLVVGAPLDLSGDFRGATFVGW
jgi:hypothetical protein